MTFTTITCVMEMMHEVQNFAESQLDSEIYDASLVYPNFTEKKEIHHLLPE